MAKWLEDIAACMRTTRNGLARMGSIFLLLAFGAMGAGILVPVKGNASAGIFLAVVFLLIAGSYLLVLAFTVHNPLRHKAISLLKNNPHQIVWVYSFVNVNMPYGVQMFKLVTVWIHLADGKQLHFRIAHNQLDGCMYALQQLLPKATFGYSVEKEQLYRASPLLLKKD